MRISVWVDNWQMQCCGDPFAVGHEVSWTLQDADDEWLANILGDDAARGVTKAEEHHGGVPDDAPATTGRVAAIKAVHHRYAPKPGDDPRARYVVPGSGVVTTIESADGWTPDQGELSFAGYIVDLDVET
ncbi:DUF6578 domain-containing protein [Cryptosporangium sp. NPDC048952]|uniref:DUF6578 domain-containing protein n=1 Tax=Cryptosporangium sp. NPDC048952 TaxID=3363961 RepID=UPI0037179B0A